MRFLYWLLCAQVSPWGLPKAVGAVGAAQSSPAGSKFLGAPGDQSVVFTYTYPGSEDDVIMSRAAMQNREHMPVWLVNHPVLRADGNLRPAKNLKPFFDLHPIVRPMEDAYRAWDDEPYFAVHKYFWGQRNGIIIEMGALDGKQFSASSDFLPLGWHRILLEGSPRYRAEGPKLSPDASFISGAVCDSGVVHYLSDPNNEGAVNGIAEFMSPRFLLQMHPHVFTEARESAGIHKGNEELLHELSATGKQLDLSNVDWTKFSEQGKVGVAGSGAKEVPCVALRDVLSTLEVPHVNFFILDVEGGELNVLKSIDFTAVKFDVLCVETDPHFRPKGYPDEVKSYLAGKGYRFVEDAGRNSWFVRHDFQPNRFAGPA